MAKITRRRFIWLAGTAAGAGFIGPGLIGNAWSSPIVRGEATGIKHEKLVISAEELATGQRENAALVDGALQAMGEAPGICISPPKMSSFPFTAIGAHWQGSDALSVALRVSGDGVVWSDWQPVLAEDGEADLAHERVGALLGLFKPAMRYVQAMVRFEEGDKRQSIHWLGLGFIDATAGPTTAEAAQGASAHDLGSLVAPPSVISRTGWGCPDRQSSPGWPAEYQTVTHLFVHNTATPNGATDWASWVRSIWTYHANTLGWADIGYNFLVDPNGYLYEGRAGGDDVVGGHVYGLNRGTVGLAFIGTYDATAPSAGMVSAAESLLAWKASQRGINPTGSQNYLAYPTCSSTTYLLPTVLGHRDAPGHHSTVPNSCNVFGPTSCPGDRLESLLPTIRTDVQQRLSSLSAAVVSASLAPARLLSEGWVRLSVTVANTGGVAIPTQGPLPAFIYDQGQTFQTAGYDNVPGAFRVGVDLQGASQDYQYRWGLGGTLHPGETRTITGYVRMHAAGSGTYSVGLVQENVRWWQTALSSTVVTVVAPQYSQSISGVQKNR